jgi:hypothetical protein
VELDALGLLVDFVKRLDKLGASDRHGDKTGLLAIDSIGLLRGFRSVH